MGLTSIKVRAHLVGNMCNKAIILYLIGRLESCLKKCSFCSDLHIWKRKYIWLMGILFPYPPYPLFTDLNAYAFFLKISLVFFQYRVSDNPGNNFAYLYWSLQWKNVYFCEVNNIPLFISIRLFSSSDTSMHHNVNTICLGLYVSWISKHYLINLCKCPVSQRTMR